MAAVEIGAYAHDDDMIEATRGDGLARVRVYPFASRAVVLGRGSKPEIEVHLARCRDDGVPLLRRHGGGCAVLLDAGNLIVSIAQSVEGPLGSRAHFERISARLIEALAAAGAPGIHREGTSDLALGDRKIAGACIYRSRNLLFYSASLLIDPDLEAVERYLPHPPREPDYRRGRSHREFMGSLLPLLDGNPASAFGMRLEQHLRISIRTRRESLACSV